MTVTPRPETLRTQFGKPANQETMMRAFFFHAAAFAASIASSATSHAGPDSILKFLGPAGKEVGSPLSFSGKVSELTSAQLDTTLPPDCPRPLRYVGNGEFYCANGNGPYKLTTQGPATVADVVTKLTAEKLAIQGEAPPKKRVVFDDGVIVHHEASDSRRTTDAGDKRKLDSNGKTGDRAGGDRAGGDRAGREK